MVSGGQAERADEGCDRARHLRHHDGGQAVLNKGRNSDSLVVALLGPDITPGTNGPPIRRTGVPEPPRNLGGRMTALPLGFVRTALALRGERRS